MKRLIQSLIILFGILFAGYFVYTFERSSSPDTKMPRAVPSAKLFDLEGGEVSIEQFTGTPLMINIWAAWCPYCREEIPDFLKLEKEKGDQLRIIFINRGEDKVTVKNFFEALLDVSSTTVMLLDPKDEFYSLMNGFSMPETLFVDKDGLIRYHKRGPMSLEEMRRRVEEIMQ